MKKIILYFIFFIVLIISMPIIFTNQFKSEEVVSNNIEEEEIKYDYGDYSNIKLLHIETGEVQNLDLDDYLLGVVSSEMPANFEIEALKAQAVVARTYTIYQIKNGSKHENADMCDNSLCCQAWISKEDRFARWEEENREEYWNKIYQAVKGTKGKIILYEGEPINALFHSNSGGKTELSINVWGGNYPYFQSVETSGEEAYTSFNSETRISKDTLIQKMLEKYTNFSIDFSKEDAIKVLEYTDSGRVKIIQIGNTKISGVDARKIFSLKSAKFDVQIKNDEIVFNVQGYGHGVGFSQCGSDAMAKSGKKYDEIIKYYYKNVEISE